MPVLMRVCFAAKNGVPSRNMLLLQTMRLHPIPKGIGNADVWFSVTT